MDDDLRRITDLLEAIRGLDDWHRETARAREELDRRLWLYGYLAVVVYFAAASLVHRLSRGATHKGFMADEYVLIAFLACIPTVP
ncbi:hypothetical protein CVIRNUC_003335 [Coccomyxa viridis]|uniref:Uncharacterized protein n=1 Tax=Coccomyxa viridis TaxID=1274662 RepID=A0AAV1I102_9CHLO|nr:hypothetical protein CVIRNUC_003335 [Coccomyxa viridis]